MSWRMKLLGLKRRLTMPHTGIPICPIFTEKEAVFLTDYLNRSLKIAVFNQNMTHMLMLQELVNKVFNSYLDAKEVAWFPDNEEEIESDKDVF